MKTKKYNWTLRHFFLLFLVFSISGSCVEDVTELTKEPARYTTSDIKSYSDLFDVFWNTMNQKYNYLYKRSSLNWEAIYKEYAPKFKGLKTFNRDKQYTKAEVSDDYNKAIEYFTEIIDPIIDRHFYVRISFPVSHSYFKSAIFYGGVKSKDKIYAYPFDLKYEYMKSKIQPDIGVFRHKNDMLGDLLSGNPDIYYFGFRSFTISSDYIVFFGDEYLVIDDKNPYYLTGKEIRDTIEAKIKDPAVKSVLIEKSIEYIDKFNSLMMSEITQDAIKKIENFKQSETIDESFIEALLKVKKNAPNINLELSQLSGLEEFKLNPNYTKWSKQHSTEHLQLTCEYIVFLSDIDNVINNQYKIDFYKNFLVPLKNGDIKRTILDLRGNGGGMILDAKTFTDRFITKDTIFGYQRFKEDNNPFSYTPRTPCMTKPTDIGIKKEIPVVILLDENSASMSEISILILKNQGEHITVVGHYNAGATAGLGDSGQFDGGLRGKVGDYLEFYIPLLTMQDATHTVIEGIEIKPDFLMEPLTEEEIYEMAFSPYTHIDRTLKQAVEILTNN